MNYRVVSFSLALATILLGACSSGGGSGGGGGVVTPPQPAQFTWSASLKPETTTAVQGKAVQRQWNGGTVFYYASGYAPPQSVDAGFKQAIGANGSTTELEISTPGQLAKFSALAGDTITSSADGKWISASTEKGIIVEPSPNSVRGTLLAANPAGSNWDYQSFGVWLGQQMITTDLTTYFVAASYGSATPGASVPTSGTATFQGLAGGYYDPGRVDPTYGVLSGQSAFVTASSALTADFAARRATFSTGTFVDAVTGAQKAGSAISGTMTYQPGVNAMAGTAETADGLMTGAISGRFYGPAAQEVGGQFALDGAINPTTGKLTTQFIGAFGGKR